MLQVVYPMKVLSYISIEFAGYAMHKCIQNPCSRMEVLSYTYLQYCCCINFFYHILSWSTPQSSINISRVILYDLVSEQD